MRASSLPLLMQCTGSLVLPCEETKSKNAEDGADWGTMVHHWVQTGEIKGRDTRSENAFKKAIHLSEIDRLALWPAGGHHEQALSVRVDGVREASRDDTVREGWITGHYDYSYWLWQDELWIDDLKTGKYYPNPLPGLPGWDPDLDTGENRFPQDPDSPQLTTYALGLAELLSYTGPVNVSVTHWPRLPLARRHTSPVRFWVKHSREDLLVHWSALENTYRETKHNERAMLGHEDSLILVSGDHCRFCPARANCFVAKEFE